MPGPADGTRPGARAGCRILLVIGMVAAAGTAAAATALIVMIASITTLNSEVAVTAAADACLAPASAQSPYSTWGAEQTTNAATILEVGQADRVPAYGQEIALATAMQESSLQNLDHGDRDSLGLFQQRPSQGWGTPAQIMDPVYAATQFYQHLLKVRGWQSMTLAQAAQAVQASGHPQAYARWQADAAALISRLSAKAAAALQAAAGQGASCAPGQPAAGTSAQLAAVMRYAISALGAPYHYGGTCTSPHSPDPSLECDCSSLVQQSFARAGISLPRTAEQQYEWGEAGHALIIPLAKAQPGDVVYMPSDLGPDTMGHTGIIVNPRTMTMLDAYETGKPVRFDSYAPSHDPYGSHMLTVLRFIRVTAAQAHP